MCEGYAAGPIEEEGGSGSNILCLPATPEWKTPGPPTDSWVSYGELVGVKYYFGFDGLFSMVNNNNSDLLGKLAPCVVCHVTRRSSVIVIPALIHCPASWTVEYRGFMVSSVADDRKSTSGVPLDIHKRSSYLCWDDAPNAGPPSTDESNPNPNRGLIIPVKVLCGSLPCNVYPNGQEVNCIVCSK